LAKGQTVIDIGCGPGFLCESMAEIVGSAGRVVGIDISADLVALATRRNSRPWLSYRIGDATLIDEPDARFDVAACTQVAEYVPDVDKAISEVFRVLKPDGRAVFVATDWDALVWHSDHPDRMAAVMKSWEAHCAHPQLPRSIVTRLRAAGFVLKEASVFSILNTEWGDDTFSKGLSSLIRDFVAGRGDVPADDLTAWLEELSQLSDEGRYFFSTNRFIFNVLKAR
jgi:SAM-dependent methyltransferase